MGQLNLRVVWAAVLSVSLGCGVSELNVEEDETIWDEANFGDHVEIDGHDHGHADELATLESELTGSVAVGSKLKTTAGLNLRTGPGTGYAVILVIPQGGTVTVAQSSPQNSFYKVTYGTKTGWAHGGYLVTTTSSTTVSVSGGPVNSNVQGFANSVCGATGSCKISTYTGHHPSRVRALDILTSNAYGYYPTDSYARGNQVAQHALNNWGKYNIWYVIWKQRINYNDGRGWQWMADRGSITQNHYDHVHISFW
jgi:uncharacterized protein YraI